MIYENEAFTGLSAGFSHQGAAIPIYALKISTTQMSTHSKSYQLDACLWPPHTESYIGIAF
jgi:hypothetical protein